MIEFSKITQNLILPCVINQKNTFVINVHFKYSKTYASFLQAKRFNEWWKIAYNNGLADDKQWTYYAVKWFFFDLVQSLLNIIAESHKCDITVPSELKNKW